VFRFEYEDDIKTLWVTFGDGYVPRMTVEFLENFLEETPKAVNDTRPNAIVFKSKHPAIFNLGGDLEFFLKYHKDFFNMSYYTNLCLSCVDLIQGGADNYAHTFSIVEGECLGGGFEAALACDQIIATPKAVFGFPEAAFGLFPGMGGYPLVAKHSDEAKAFEIVRGDRSYNACDLRGTEIVKRNTDKPAHLTREIIRAWDNKDAGWKHAQKIRKLNRIVPRKTLDTVADYWVQCVLKLSDENIDKLSKIRRAQRILEERLK